MTSKDSYRNSLIAVSMWACIQTSRPFFHCNCSRLCRSTSPNNNLLFRSAYILRLLSTIWFISCANQLQSRFIHSYSFNKNWKNAPVYIEICKHKSITIFVKHTIHTMKLLSYTLFRICISCIPGQDNNLGIWKFPDFLHCSTQSSKWHLIRWSVTWYVYVM